MHDRVAVPCEVDGVIPVDRRTEHGANGEQEFLKDLGVAQGVVLPHVVAVDDVDRALLSATTSERVGLEPGWSGRTRTPLALRSSSFLEMNA